MPLSYRRRLLGGGNRSHVLKRARSRAAGPTCLHRLLQPGEESHSPLLADFSPGPMLQHLEAVRITTRTNLRQITRAPFKGGAKSFRRALHEQTIVSMPDQFRHDPNIHGDWETSTR